MHIFRIRPKGTRRFTNILARNPAEAQMKFRMLMESKRLTVRDPPLKPGSLMKTRKIFRGVRK